MKVDGRLQSVRYLTDDLELYEGHGAKTVQARKMADNSAQYKFTEVKRENEVHHMRQPKGPANQMYSSIRKH